MRARKYSQRGVAAIEFAIVFMALFLVLYGIATFGVVLYTQQAVSRAAEDGARAAPFQKDLFLPDGQVEVAKEAIKSAVRNSLAGSLIVPPEHSATPTTRLGWITDKVAVDIDLSSSISTATVTVSYPYSQNMVFPPLPLLNTDSWMPSDLTGRATVVLRS